MTTPIDFFIPGEPVPWPRAHPRIIRQGGKPRAIMYYPSDERSDAQKLDPNCLSIAEWKSRVKRAGAAAFKGCEPIDGAVRLCLQFFFSRPDWHFRGKARVLREDAPRHHTVKPDADNLQKVIMDSLNKIAWTDDCRICQPFADKLYVLGQEKPGCRIVITKPESDHLPLPSLFAEAAG